MKGKNVYIASSLSNVKGVQRLRDLLITLGHKLTHDWTMVGKVDEFDPREEIPEGEGLPATIMDCAIDDAGGVTSADALIVVLPGGVGTHAELGVALGWNRAAVDTYNIEHIKVFLWAEGGLAKFVEPGKYECAFWYHPDVVLVTGELVDMVTTFETWAKAKR